MRNSYSRTAQSMAVLRAIEHVGRPRDEQILCDPWALRFIPSPLWRVAAALPPTAWAVSQVIRMWIPGAQEYAVARARRVDELTAQLTHDGLEQLVILGAGFDTTVFRLRKALRDVSVFEVDHPATQREKLARLGRPPIPVRFVTVDFETESFPDRLMAAGFDPARPTLLTWLGVSYYLTPAAVANTFRRVAGLLTSGSRFVFDFVPPEAASGTMAGRGLQNGLREAARLGEPFLCGLDPHLLAGEQTEYGFRLSELHSPETLRRRYCRGGRAPVPFMWLAETERI